jgi:hypothetical protein
MNLGIAKEQLYVTPPFPAIFARFREKLRDAGIIITAGYSFRDPAVNRLFLETIQRRHIPFVVIDPQAETLRAARGVLRGLDEAQVLIPCAKKLSQVQQSDVEEWVQTSLPPRPTSRQIDPETEPDWHSNRVPALEVELSLLEHYIPLIVKEINDGKLVPYELINCLVQAVERCRRTHLQILIARNVKHSAYQRAWHGAYASEEPIDLKRSGDALVASLMPIQEILREGGARLYKAEPLRQHLDNILTVLQDGGVLIH